MRLLCPDAATVRPDRVVRASRRLFITGLLLATTALARKTTREEQQAIASLPSAGKNPLVSLEHINLSSGDKWSERVDAFYFDVLRCARDPRSPAVLARTNAARAKQRRPGVANQSWANVGFQQFHLLFGDGLDEEMNQPPQQRLRGEIVLAWPRDKMKGLYARLAEWGAAFTGIGTFEGPFGNRFRLIAADDFLKPLPDATADDRPPGGDSEGLGIRSVRFDAPRGASGPICEFYSSVFNAVVDATGGRCVVSVGTSQTLEFVEADDVAAYDGHHIALYVDGAAFVRGYGALKARGLVFENRRFLQFTCRAASEAVASHRHGLARRYGTLADAMKHDEFRVKDIAGNDNQIVYELEHEIRTLNHPGFVAKKRLKHEEL